MVLIYGKDSCPYTADARKHYSRGPMEYINVKKDADGLMRMLELTGNRPAGAGDRRERQGDDRLRRHLRSLTGPGQAPSTSASSFGPELCS